MNHDPQKVVIFPILIDIQDIPSEVPNFEPLAQAVRDSLTDTGHAGTC
jgi:hypothetical protein